MPNLEIAIPVDAADMRRLADALGPNRDPEQLAHVIAKAGAAELLAQATGHAVFSGITDLRLFRIFCLLQQGISLPDAEALVAVIFKVPQTTARRLLQATIARFDLQAEVSNVVAGALDGAEWDPEALRWRVKLSTSFMRERLRLELETNGIMLPTKSTKGGEWLFPEESFDALRQVLHLAPKHHP